jgi:hypothetical protein
MPEPQCTRHAVLKTASAAAEPMLKENTQKVAEFTQAVRQKLSKEMAEVVKESSKATNRPPT